MKYRWNIRMSKALGIVRQKLAAGIFLTLMAGAGVVFLWAGLALNPALPGDLNNDSKVDLTDLSFLLTNWNSTNSDADVNADGRVTLADLSVLLSNWGRVLTTQPPPETGMATYYVSPSGNDSNPGNHAKPFATLAKARDVVRTRNSNMTGDITVYVRAGTYRQTDTLNFEAQDSGNGGYSVRYLAYPGERPVISGGMPVAGWTQHDAAKGIWKAHAGASFQTRTFFVNGVKAQRARSADDQIPFTKTDSGFSTTNTAIASWGNRQEIELVGHNMQKFYRCRIDTVSGGSITLTQPCWDNSQISKPEFKKVHWVENAYELLDEAGEWYLDNATGTMYYKPRAGENMATARAIAGDIETVVSVKSAANLKFSGLTVAYNTWNFPSSDVGYVGLQQGEHPWTTWDGDLPEERFIPGSVSVLTGKNLSFEHMTFANLAGVGIAFDDGSQNISVTGSRFEALGNNAINIGDALHNHPEPAEEDRGYIIANNYITRIGLDYPNSAGIWGGYVADVNIHHNEVFDVPQKGIAVGWGWGATSYAEDNKINYNYIHQYTTVLEDSGGVYTLSPQPNTEIAYNYIDHDVNGYNCLYPDEGSAFTNWHHNVCKRVGQWLHLWTDSIHDNKIQFNYADTTTQENAGVNNTVSDNTFVTDGNWPAEAQNIMNNAGIEAAYRGIKSGPLMPN
jgi:hypothetical protein